MPNGIEGAITGGIWLRGTLKARVFASDLMEIVDNHAAEINSNTSVHSISQGCCKPILDYSSRLEESIPLHTTDSDFSRSKTKDFVFRR